MYNVYRADMYECVLCVSGQCAEQNNKNFKYHWSCS